MARGSTVSSEMAQQTYSSGYLEKGTKRKYGTKRQVICSSVKLEGVFPTSKVEIWILHWADNSGAV